MSIEKYIEKVMSRNDLSKDEMKSAMHEIMSGAIDEPDIISFLISLKTKGESIDEIIGAAEILREMAVKIDLKTDKIVDTCGTGGDTSNTFNISTASAIVAASAGVKIAKHGNKSVSSKSGSADLLALAGYDINLSIEKAIECFDKHNLTFMFAPKYHSAMKNVAKARSMIKTRTIFNILGPLANPASADRQVLGVFDQNLMEPMSQALIALGVKKALIVHSEDGLDEISIFKDTHVLEIKDNKISKYEINANEFCSLNETIESIQVNSAEESFQMILDAFENKNIPAKEIIAINAAASIYLSEICTNLEESYKLAKEMIETGKAKKKLDDIVEFTKSIPKEKNILDEIIEYKRKEVEDRKNKMSLEALSEIDYMRSLKRDFKGALLKKLKENKPAVIAEIKRASPSKGDINLNIVPAKIAFKYEEMGAACISVLTDQKYFKGSGVILEMAKKSSSLPILRKDFIVDEYQLHESVTMGADCILLIVAALSEDEFIKLYTKAKELNLDVLVEVHDAEELVIAQKVNADIIGINNRNLKNFKVDITTCIELSKNIHKEVIIVAESGIKDSKDISLMQKNNINSFLIGETFMLSDDPVQTFKDIFSA